MPNKHLLILFGESGPAEGVKDANSTLVAPVSRTAQVKGGGGSGIFMIASQWNFCFLSKIQIYINDKWKVND